MTIAVLITGTSSGIGRATALRLTRHPDFTVYATARRPQTLTDLAEAGARTLALNAAADQQMAHTYQSTRLSAPPEAVAEAIFHAATDAKPRSRYVVTAAAKALIHTRRLLGARVFDAYLRRQFKAAG